MSSLAVRTGRYTITLAPTLGLVLAATMAATQPAGAGETADFPPGFEPYHTNRELVAELRAIEAAQPSDPDDRIFSMVVAGQSHEGRDIWLIKISDHVQHDEDEPEVYFDALTHAQEHLTVEQALWLIHRLVDGYGDNARITDIVDRTEIWVIPSLNPDGGEYDIAHGRFHSWRKNRQPTPGSGRIGTDLNRNFGYRWGCCAGSSADPASRYFRGPSKWSAPETRVARDVVRGRVVGGSQQIVLAMDFHSWGEKIVFPYDYTTDAVPPDMEARDRRAMKAMAHAMAARNGYDVIQGGRWYVGSGTAMDWAYGRHGIFAFTFELAPDTSGEGGSYLPASRIDTEVSRNRSALLWFLEQASCRYAVLGVDC